MVKMEWGIKRTCQGCQARFYDLRKSPIICPKCDTTFEIQTSTRGRKAKIAEAEKLIPRETKEENDDTVIDLDEDIDEDIDDSSDDDLIEDDSEIDEDVIKPSKLSKKKED